jgi:hypothetical protein
MNAVTPVSLPASLQTLAATAVLFEKLEQQPRGASPGQYRAVAQRLAELLRAAAPGESLDALLGALPATAEVYENLQYEHAGLCRAPLERALNAELAAAAAIRHARKR